MHLFLPEQKDKWARICWLEGAFSREECDRIIDLAKIINRQKATVGSEEASDDLRRSEIAWIPSMPESEWLYRKLSNLAMGVNNERYGFDLSGFTDDLQYTEYDQSGHYGWHQDFAYGPFSTRKLSQTVLLSDPSEYEGGNLELFGETTEIPRTQGTIIMFPSFEFHRVNPVTRGLRKSLVAWVVGPPYR